jgi:hypothetical protein
MNTKMFEIRDRGTLIPVIATKLVAPTLNEAEAFLLQRAGYSPSMKQVLVSRIEGGDCKSGYTPFDWLNGTRTMLKAHEYIEKCFDELESGAVVDVEYILGETNKMKQSERFINS